jgi:hypothetical protein
MSRQEFTRMARFDLPREKKVKHLTLLRAPRRLTPREFNALTFAERLEMARSAQGRQKYDLLIEAQDAEELVRRLPAQELFILFKEMGAEDVPELLPLVTCEQFTTFLDLDCWQGDLLDGDQALYWLTLLVEAGEEAGLRMAVGIDFGLLVLTVKKFITITAAPGDMLDEDEAAARRFEGIYEVDYRDAASARIVGAFLDLIIRRERDFYMQLMEAVRWEPEVPLEEEVYGAHRDRLLDHGFPDPFEALGVYAWLDPDTFDPAQQRKLPLQPGEVGVEAPAFALASARPKDLLAEILAGGLDHDTCWELTFLINKVMSAERVDVGESSQVRETTEEVYRYLNLALEHLSGGDLGTASALFEDCYLEHLFRLGFSLTLQLQRRAKKLAAGPIGPYLDGPLRAFLDALRQRRPRFYEGIDAAERAGERPFANVHDLALAMTWLERLAGQRRLFEERFPFDLPAPGELDLTGCAPADPADLTLSDFLLTALANRILGRAFVPRPVPQEELPALHARICREGKVDPELRRETGHWLDSLEPGASAFGDWCLDLWEQELCAASAEDLDPRFVSGVIIRLA